MKGLLMVLLSLLLCIGNGLAADIPGELRESIPDSALEIELEEGWNTGFTSLWDSLEAHFQEIIRDGTGGAVKLLLVVILSGIVESVFLAVKRKGGFHYVSLAASAAVVLVAVGDVDHLMGLGREIVMELEQFSKALLPALAAATASMGLVGAASVRQVATVLFCDILLTLIDRLIFPLIYVYIIALSAGSMLSDSRLNMIAVWMKKGIVWVLGGLLTLFTIYLTLAGAVTGTADAAAVRTAKKAIAGAVPVVGGILSGAADAVLSGAGILKNSIGVFGVLIVLATCAIPFLRMAVQYLLYKFCAFIAASVAPQQLVKLIDGLGGAFGLVLGAVGSCALVLLISLLSSLMVVTV